MPNLATLVRQDKYSLFKIICYFCAFFLTWSCKEEDDEKIIWSLIQLKRAVLHSGHVEGLL